MVTLLLFVATGVPHSPREDEAIQVIERAVAALGKPDVKGEVALRITGKKTVAMQPVEYVQTWLTPNFLHYEQTWRDRDQVNRLIIVFDGTNGWSKQDQTTRKLNGAELDVLREMSARGEVHALEDLKDLKRFKLTLLPELKDKDEVYIGVRVQSDDQPDTYLYFSKRTHLL